MNVGQGVAIGVVILSALGLWWVLVKAVAHQFVLLSERNDKDRREVVIRAVNLALDRERQRDALIADDPTLGP